MNDQRRRRISDAMDAQGGIQADAEVSAWLADDPSALAYAQDLVRIDEVLKSLGAGPVETDWDALASRIEARLDDELAPLADVGAPPTFSDGDAASVEAPAVAESPAPVTAARPPASVVPLAPRRRAGPLYWAAGLAAAAAVGLGITFGLVSLGSEPAAEMAAATFPASHTREAMAPSPPMAEAAEMPAALMAPVDPAPAAMAEPMPVAQAAPAEAPADDFAPRQEARRPAGPAPAGPAPAPLTLAARERSSSGGGRGGSEVLDPFASGPPRPAPTRPATARPTRPVVLSALQSVEPTVQRCLRTRGEVAGVAIQVGADGSVLSVRVDPPYVGDEAGCIVRAVRTARLPSSPEDYQVVHTFRPAPVAGGSLRDDRRPAARRQARTPAAQYEVVDPYAY